MFSMELRYKMNKGIDELIRLRRSTYADSFTGAKIPRKLLVKILENATWAPTHKMTEPWRFIVLEGELLTDYGSFMSDHYMSKYVHLGPEAMDKKKEYLKNYPRKAACMVAIICRYNRTVALPEWEEVAAVASAVQNMALSCTYYGYGSYWATGTSAISYVEKLGLEENEQPLGLFFIGKTANGKEVVTKKRTPVMHKTTWINDLNQIDNK